VKGPPEVGPIIGESMAIRRARELIERYAATSLAILLVGATGTGKELLARHIHGRSGRRGRFVGLNCGVLPRDMADGLLFGYDRGAFSGAVKRHRGHVECADEGTFLLDELLCLPMDGQAKLLRVLDSGEFQRLGEETVRYADVRVIGAVQEDVGAQVRAGAFRLDLYQRLAGVVIELPPLADRPGDIVPLAAHFAAQRQQVLEPAAAEELTRHTWPGNVRELRLAIERAGCLVNNGTLPRWAIRRAVETGATCSRVTEDVHPPALGPKARAALSACERCGWDTREAAKVLGVTRSTVYERLKAAGISLRALRKARAHSEFRWNSDGIPASADAPT